MRSHIIIAALLVAPGATLLAQDTITTQKPQSETIRGYNPQQNMGRRDSLQGDNALVMKIHKINQMEIKAGQLAQRNSSTAKVKSYGQQLVRDHQSADQKLTTLAQSLGVTFKDDSTTGRYQQPVAQQPVDTTKSRSGQPADSAMPGHDQDAMREHQQMKDQLQRLSTLQGTQFDAEFANFMAQGHDKAIKMFEQAQSTVQNAQLRTFITSTLPTLRTHLQVAQSLGGSTTATTTTSSQ